MSMPSTLTRRGRLPGEDAPPDRGCFVSPRCVDCPLRVCVKEMRHAERGEFTAAWRTIARYMAPPDRTLE